MMFLFYWHQKFPSHYFAHTNDIYDQISGTQIKQLINLPHDTFVISHPMCIRFCLDKVRTIEYIVYNFQRNKTLISGPAAKIFIYLYHFMTIIKSNCTARLCTATNENTDDMMIWIKCFISSVRLFWSSVCLVWQCKVILYACMNLWIYYRVRYFLFYPSSSLSSFILCSV